MFRHGARRVSRREEYIFDGVDPSKLKGIWAPFQAIRSFHGMTMRIRRTSGGEADVKGYSHIAGFIQGTTGFVTTLYDQSGNGNDVVQTTADNQPGITLLANGLIELEFDGTNDSLRRNAQVVSGASEFDLILVVDHLGVGDDAISTTQSDVTPTRYAVGPRISSDRWRGFARNDANTAVGAADSSAISTPHVSLVRGGRAATPASVVQVWNSAAVENGDFAGTHTYARLDIGVVDDSSATNYYAGSIRFAAAAQSRLSDAEWALIGARLAAGLGVDVE